MYTNNDKGRIVDAAKRLFAGHHVCLANDPEDESIAYVRVFGVADVDVRTARHRLWETIKGLSDEVDVSRFVPSIVSLSDTAQFYPAFMPEIPDDEAAIPTQVLAEIEQEASPGNTCPARQLPGLEWPNWNPQRPSIVSDIDSMEEVSDAREIRFAA